MLFAAHERIVMDEMRSGSVVAVVVLVVVVFQGVSVMGRKVAVGGQSDAVLRVGVQGHLQPPGSCQGVGVHGRVDAWGRPGPAQRLSCSLPL